MKLRAFYLSAALAALTPPLHAQPIPVSIQEGDPLNVDLTGWSWKMKRMHPGQGLKEGLHRLPPEDIETLVWNPAYVPGDVYTDLWKAGVIDDPYFGRNGARAQWVMLDEWWYALQFAYKVDLTDKAVRLDFDGVDYSCDVWLNGHHLGRHEGAYSPFSFDVTEVLRSSKGGLACRNMLMVKLDPPPKVNALVAGRKAPWFGDYWRGLIPFGIWRPIRLVTTGICRIRDVYVRSTIHGDGSATVTLDMELENTGSQARRTKMVASVQGKNFESAVEEVVFDQTLRPGRQIVKKNITIRNAKLWWPWDLGRPNLYVAKVTLREAGREHDSIEEPFGIREVSMAWNPGFSKQEVSFPRTTLINGKTHWIRSACWGGPPDIFFGRTSVREYRKLIGLAKEANMNNIRIFGWHPPEIKEFYDLCDEAGLTVWQDVVPLGTGNLPKDESFLDRIIAEAVAVIKQRRNHPCLIMIEGGEEMFLRSGDPLFTRRFLERLGNTLQTYVDLPYVPDSPLTCQNAQKAGYKPKEAHHALAYFYGMGRFLMEDWIAGMDYPIIPELAVTSVPSVDSLKKFIPEAELWPPGLSWGYHWADLDRLRWMNWDTFGSQKTGSLEEFVDATQDAQGTVFQLCIEHFRRRKPRTSGISLCHFITYWPDMKWGFVDNYQQPKRSYYFVRRAYQPLLVSMQFDKRRWKNAEPFRGKVWVVNDEYRTHAHCRVEVTINDNDGNELSKTVVPVPEIAENSSAMFGQISMPVLQAVRQYFHATLSLKDRSGAELSSNQYMFLIGDQAKASADFKRLTENARSRRFKYTNGNYYRYFPSMLREDGQDHDSDLHTPRARGFTNE